VRNVRVPFLTAENNVGLAELVEMDPSVGEKMKDIIRRAEKKMWRVEKKKKKIMHRAVAATGQYGRNRCGAWRIVVP
jgi:hypothetical protein